MAEEQAASGGASLVTLLKRKFGPAPLWLYLLIGILALAWFIRYRQQKAAATQGTEKKTSGGQPQTFDGSVLDQFALAYPMPYQSDVFVNIKNEQPDVTVNNTTTLPHIEPVHHPLPTPTPAPQQTSISYTVKSGDTLWDIARKYLGDPTKYPLIYQANKGTIEAVARQHGYSSSGSGHWIFPGETLVIPK